MGYGIVDVWIRDAKCFRPAYDVDWFVSIKDCLGRSPKGYRASGNALGEVEDQDDPPQGLGKWEPAPNCFNVHAGRKAHAMVKVPPGCYVVDAWDRRWGYNAHETMVVVSCGERVCVNLLAGVRGSDVVPIIVRAQEARLNVERISALTNTVLEVLRALPQVRVDMAEAEYSCLLETTEKEVAPLIKRLRPLLIGEELPQVRVEGSER